MSVNKGRNNTTKRNNTTRDVFSSHSGYFVTKDDIERLPCWYSKVGWTCCGKQEFDKPCATMKPDDLTDQKRVKESQRSLIPAKWNPRATTD